MKFIDYFLCNIVILLVIEIMYIASNILYGFEFDYIGTLIVRICIMIFISLHIMAIYFTFFIHIYFHYDNVLFVLHIN
jgi:hypothetical protein